MQKSLDELQTWYAAQCDGDWEHCFGIRICSLDNPGWSVEIDLQDTKLENKAFTSFDIQDSEQSWLRCKVEKVRFVGLGDPTKLEDILKVFLKWAKTEADWLDKCYETETDAELRKDRELLAALGDEVGEQCSNPQCARHKIRDSVFCRSHHFEMVRGKPAPPDLNKF